MQKKIERLRKLWQVTGWAMEAMCVSLIPIWLLEGKGGPYFTGLFLVCVAVALALVIWVRIWAKKLLRCPYCLYYSYVTASAFLKGKEESFLCPHCGKEIPAMDREEK